VLLDQFGLIKIGFQQGLIQEHGREILLAQAPGRVMQRLSQFCRLVESSFDGSGALPATYGRGHE
jgi:hypothetical protein